MKKHRKKVVFWESMAQEGGGQRITVQAAKALAAHKDYETVFVVPKEGPLTKTLETEGIRYWTLDIGNYTIGRKNIADILRFAIKSFSIIKKIGGILKKENAALLYVGGQTVLIWGAIVSAIYRTPVIWHMHHLIVDKKIRLIINLIGLSGIVDRIICVSNCTRMQFKGWDDVAQVIYNGVDLERFSTPGDSRIRNELHIDEKAPILLSIGFIQEGKLPDVLVRATKDIVLSHPDVKVLLVGGERDEDKSYSKYLRSLISDLGLEQNVLMLGHRSDIPQLLAEATVTVGMGEESCPLFVLESLASGTPVIGPNCGGSQELINGSLGGATYQWKDPHSLAKAIEELLKNESVMLGFSKNGKSFMQRHSIRSFQENIYRAIEDLTGSKN